MSPTFISLTPYLWVQQSKLYRTNSGLFISRGQACLIDPCIFPAEIEAMADFLLTQCAEPQVLLLTHSHWDHILGPAHFPGVKVIAQANYGGIIAKHGGRLLKQIADWEKRHNLERDNPFMLPQPDDSFEEAMRLTIGDLVLELLHVPGHAADQLAVYHADNATLWASDILSDVEIPFLSDSLAAYEQTLTRLATLAIRALVPGHGHATGDPADIQTRLAEDMAYLTTLRERITNALREGRSIEETVAICQDIPYRLPEENKGPHKLNIESTYLELGGEADSQKFGWKQNWNSDI